MLDKEEQCNRDKENILSVPLTATNGKVDNFSTDYDVTKEHFEGGWL